MICLYVWDWKTVVSTADTEAAEINVNADS